MDLFSQDRFFSLFEILSTVNNAVPFADCFKHWKIKHNREKPNNKTFFVGIIGLGCNLEIRKIVRISNNISQHTLENTVKKFQGFIMKQTVVPDMFLVLGKDRQGNGLLAVSIAIVSNKTHAIDHVAQISELAAELKKLAKNCEGNNFVRDQRKG